MIFKKKIVNIGSGKVQSKPSIFTAPSFMEPFKTSIIRERSQSPSEGRKENIVFPQIESSKKYNVDKSIKPLDSLTPKTL